MSDTTKQNLTVRLTHDLGIDIVRGVYPIGTGVPSEAELCTQYNVSRSCIREAVKMLSAKGLISSRPKQGIRVLPETSWNMFDTDVLKWILGSKPSLTLLKEFTQMRLAIEPQSAVLACLNATDMQLQDIEKALDRMKDAEQGLDDTLQADIAFHTSILVASGNRFFVQLSDFISTALHVSIRYTNRIKGVSGPDVEKHSDIYNMIKSRDPEKAQKAVFKILHEALALIESQL